MIMVCLIYLFLLSVPFMESKRARLNDYGRKSHLSVSALSAILKDVKEMGIPESSSVSTINRAKKDELLRDTPHGPILVERMTETISGKEEPIYFANPFALLHTLMARLPSFKSFLLGVFAANGNVLDLVIYSDEVNPGRALAARLAKQVQAVYWSILSFGPRILSDENAWFVLSTTLSSTVNTMVGGMAQMFKLSLKQFIDNGPRGNDLFAGVTIYPEIDKPMLITGYLAAITQDERAHKYSAEVLGAGGHKICALCSNCLNHRSSWLPDSTGFYKPSTNLQINDFIPYSNEDIRNMQRRLKEVHDTQTNGKLKKLEQQFGYKYSPAGFLQDEYLIERVDLADAWAWDILHCMFLGGLATNEAEATLIDLNKVHCGPAAFDTYLNTWVWPKAYSGAHKLCEDKKKANGAASEWISAFPVLRRFITNVASLKPNVDPLKMLSLVLLCKLVDICLAACHGTVTAEILNFSLLQFLEAHQRAYGDELWKPKSHYCLHFIRQVARRGFLLCTFVQERKHRLIKRMQSTRSNLTGFSKGCLIDTVLQQMYDMEQPLGQVSMVEPRQANKQITTAMHKVFSTHAPVFTASSCRLNARTCTQGDVVINSLLTTS